MSICNSNNVNIYNGCTANITVSEAAVLKGWRCPQTKLWRVPLQDNGTSTNTDTLLLDGSTPSESLNAMYVLPSAASMCQHIAAL